MGAFDRNFATLPDFTSEVLAGIGTSIAPAEPQQNQKSNAATPSGTPTVDSVVGIQNLLLSKYETRSPSDDRNLPDRTDSRWQSRGGTGLNSPCERSLLLAVARSSQFGPFKAQPIQFLHVLRAERISDVRLFSRQDAK